MFYWSYCVKCCPEKEGNGDQENLAPCTTLCKAHYNLKSKEIYDFLENVQWTVKNWDPQSSKKTSPFYFSNGIKLASRTKKQHLRNQWEKQQTKATNNKKHQAAVGTKYKLQRKQKQKSLRNKDKKNKELRMT